MRHLESAGDAQRIGRRRLAIGAEQLDLQPLRRQAPSN